MKHIYSFLACLLCAVSLSAAPFYVRVNGTTDYAATAVAEQDMQGRDQYVATCVPLSVGDVVTCYDEAENVAWAIAAIDPYGAYTSFDCTATGLVCKTAGSYNFYIKLKFEDDLWYVQTGTDCSVTPDPEPDSDPTPDPEPDPESDSDPTPDPEPDPEPTPEPYTSSVPSQCTDVLFQAFYWDSNGSGKKHGDTRWTTLLKDASEIAAYFDLVWLPPSAKSSGGVGYLPSQYSNQNSAWGTRAELESLVSTLHAGGAKVIADIVINHANNKSSWCDFYEEDFGEYGKFYPDASWICQTDEVNSSSSAGACKGKATGAADDGYGDEANYAAARDWDHQNEEVREMFRAYLKWMKSEMQYDGVRYDYCKGFHNSHIDDYNKAAEMAFSVMEYWDGNKAVLQSRLSDANWNTLVFDFGTKYDAFNNSMAAGNYSGCKAPGLLGSGKSKYAVTFVDSHDTYQRDNNEFGGLNNSMTTTLKDRLLQANAFMLAMPGVPCVFYPHWKVYKSALAPMVLARKAVGVHSESAVSDEGDASGYRATVTGKNGTLILELGNKVSSSQSGYTLAASGTGYKMWTKTTKAVAPKLVITPGTSTFKTETLTVAMEAIGGTEANPNIYYTLDGTDPASSSTRVQYTEPLVLTGTTTVTAYAVTATTQSEVQTCVYTYKAPQTTPIVVSFYKPSSWTKVYLYSWTKSGTNTTEYTGKWPGTQLTVTNDEGFYYYQFDAAVKEVNFIFNAGSGNDQTSDLWTDEDVCYMWSGGAEKLLPDCQPTAIENVESDTPVLDPTAPMYNILGMQVDARYHGIVVQQGTKFLLQ